MPGISHGIKRLYGFGLLPFVPEVTTSALLQIMTRPYYGTQGIGKDLDDEALDSVWAAIEKASLVIFILIMAWMEVLGRKGQREA